MCYFSCKAHKVPFLAVFTLFPILGKIQDGDKDGEHYWWRHRPASWPLNIPYLVKKIKGFRLKAESFRKTATYQKLQERVQSTPPLYHCGGINSRVRPWVKSCQDGNGN